MKHSAMVTVWLKRPVQSRCHATEIYTCCFSRFGLILRQIGLSFRRIVLIPSKWPSSPSKDAGRDTLMVFRRWPVDSLLSGRLLHMAHCIGGRDRSHGVHNTDQSKFNLWMSTWTVGNRLLAERLRPQLSLTRHWHACRLKCHVCYLENLMAYSVFSDEKKFCFHANDGC